MTTTTVGLVPPPTLTELARARAALRGEEQIPLVVDLFPPLTDFGIAPLGRGGFHAALAQSRRIAQDRRKNQSPGRLSRIRNLPDQRAVPRRRSQRLAAKPKVSYTV